jgi:hypothetical protein
MNSVVLCVEASWNTSTAALRVVGGDENGARSLKVQKSYPITGGHNYTDLVFQSGGWTQGSWSCCIKTSWLRNPKE